MEVFRGRSEIKMNFKCVNCGWKGELEEQTDCPECQGLLMTLKPQPLLSPEEQITVTTSLYHARGVLGSCRQVFLNHERLSLATDIQIAQEHVNRVLDKLAENEDPKRP